MIKAKHGNDWVPPSWCMPRTTGGELVTAPRASAWLFMLPTQYHHSKCGRFCKWSHIEQITHNKTKQKNPTVLYNMKLLIIVHSLIIASIDLPPPAYPDTFLPVWSFLFLVLPSCLYGLFHLHTQAWPSCSLIHTRAFPLQLVWVVAHECFQRKIKLSPQRV